MAITRDLWIVLRARDEASRIVRSFGHNVSGAANSAAANVSNFERRMNSVAVAMNQFAMTSMLAGTAMAGFGVAGLHFMKQAANVAVEYDKQVRRTLTQVDDITVTLEKLANVGRRVAREVEIPFEQMQETLFFIFSSMNVNLEEAEKLLKGFAKEAVAGQTTIEAAARSNIAIMNALGLSVADLGRIQDVQFQTVRKGIITYEELANVIGRVLPAAARSGQSIETVGAMMAFLTKNGLSAAMASASAARALESFAHPLTVKRLEQIGIKVRDAKGEFLPLVNVMGQMEKVLAKMSTPQRAAFFQELFKGAGGTIQARRFWDTAFKNFGEFEQMMGFMSNSAGVFEDSYATMADSVTSKTILLENKWKLIKETLGRAVIPHLLTLMTHLGKVLDWFERLPEPTKNFIAQVILFGSILAIAVGALIIFIGALAFFVSSIIAGGLALAGILATIALLTVAIVALGAGFMAAWKDSIQFRDLVGEIGKVFKDLWGQAVETGNKLKESFNANLRPSLEKLWETVQTKVLPAVKDFIKMAREEMIPKIEEAGRIVKDVFDKTFTFVGNAIDNVIIPAINRLNDWWEKNKESVRPLLELSAQIVKWFLVIAGVLLALPLAALVTGIVAVVAVIVTFISVIKMLWGWFITAKEAIKDFGTFVTTLFLKGLEQGLNKAKELWSGLLSATKKTWEDVKTAVQTGIDNIIGFFTGAKDWLLSAGENIIKGLIDGISKKIGDLKNKLKEITDAIPNWKGPRSVDLRLLLPVGQRIMRSLMSGISSQVPLLRKQLQGITAQVGQLPTPTIAIPTQSLTPSTDSVREIKQYITVNTNEINPRIHATELGWELANRM